MACFPIVLAISRADVLAEITDALDRSHSIAASEADGPARLIISDRMMPDDDSRWLFVADDLPHGVAALESGADDFVVRPVQSSELNARVTAIQRRCGGLLRIGNVALDFEQGLVLVGGEEVGVSNKELRLLQYLAARRGRTVSREELLQQVWRYRTSATRTVDFHVASLRKKLRQADLIETVSREGYRLRAG